VSLTFLAKAKTFLVEKAKKSGYFLFGATGNNTFHSQVKIHQFIGLLLTQVTIAIEFYIKNIYAVNLSKLI
jgi:hypothetical protein